MQKSTLADMRISEFLHIHTGGYVDFHLCGFLDRRICIRSAVHIGATAVRQSTRTPARRGGGCCRTPVNSGYLALGTDASRESAATERPAAPDVLAQIDRAEEGRRVKVRRHTWLIEAVIEKLEREA